MRPASASTERLRLTGDHSIMAKVDMCLVGAEAICESGGLINFVRGVLPTLAHHGADGGVDQIGGLRA